MKKVMLLLLLFIAASAKAQNAGVTDMPIRLKHLPKEGVLLNKGWKFQADDNQVYADPAYNDNQWQPIDPTKDIHDLPQLWKGIGWFRFKIYLDSNILSQPLALHILQRGASEIYVNGKLLHRFGTVSTQADKILAYTPEGKPLPLQHLQKGQNVLAIRYVLQPNILYTTNTLFRNPALVVGLENIHDAIKEYTDGHRLWIGSEIFRAGAFFILFILHLAFYLYSPSQRANLYFSLFALFVILTSIFQVVNIHRIQEWFYNRTLVLDFLLLSTFFLLTAIYSLLKQKRGWIYWSLTALLTLTILLSVVTYRLGDFIGIFIITNLFNLEIAHIAYLAVKRKQRGARIIATGAFCCLVFWTILLLSFPLKFNATPLISLYTYGHLSYMLAFLSVPVATSIYLGLDFAFTSTSLKQKLEEVERLSHEKQQILTSQKETLEQQVTDRTAALNHSLQELKATQAQLVQREKMASLGELTAGIAHEIQNPLNFVNNFSEINTELLDELKQEAQSGNTEDVVQLIAELKANEQKIADHGKRAEAIVKGMLQHARTSTGIKEPTDINALCEEYLRLSYHGLRAKDKSFNATLQTAFDESIGKVDVVPQDLGRVLLNLFNNAFYATAEQQKKVNGTFIPLVSVSTKQLNGRVEIQVKDNGPGMSQKVMDKIFQPFFTTKPAGEGTGLGLSLSYDIITKGHGGELLATSETGKGATFILRLPSRLPLSPH
jgi:two-component system, NtrC family, sensor kinase